MDRWISQRSSHPDRTHRVTDRTNTEAEAQKHTRLWQPSDARSVFHDVNCQKGNEIRMNWTGMNLKSKHRICKKDFLLQWICYFAQSMWPNAYYPHCLNILFSRCKKTWWRSKQMSHHGNCDAETITANHHICQNNCIFNIFKSEVASSCSHLDSMNSNLVFSWLEFDVHEGGNLSLPL